MVKPACITPSEGNSITIKLGESTLEDDHFPVPCWRSLMRLQLIAELLSQPYLVTQTVPCSSSNSGAGRNAQRKGEDWEAGLCREQCHLHSHLSVRRQAGTSSSAWTGVSPAG